MAFVLAESVGLGTWEQGLVVVVLVSGLGDTFQNIAAIFSEN